MAGLVNNEVYWAFARVFDRPSVGKHRCESTRLCKARVEEISLMKKFAFVLALSLVVSGLSIAAEPEILMPGPGGNPAGYDRTVLWLDNPDFDANAGSSEIMGEFGLESEVANDFILDVAATVQKVTWWGVYWNGLDTDWPLLTGMNLRFYLDAGCLPEVNPFLEYLLPDDNCCVDYAPGGDGLGDFIYEYCVEVPLDAGLFWFSAQHGDHPFLGQWGRLGADQTQICDSAFRSEYFAYPEWVPAPDVFGDLYDASVMIEDECIPTATENASWGAIKSMHR